MVTLFQALLLTPVRGWLLWRRFVNNDLDWDWRRWRRRLHNGGGRGRRRNHARWRLSPHRQLTAAKINIILGLWISSFISLVTSKRCWLSSVNIYTYCINFLKIFYKKNPTIKGYWSWVQVNQKCNLTSTSHKNAKETFIFATILLFNQKKGLACNLKMSHLLQTLQLRGQDSPELHWFQWRPSMPLVRLCWHFSSSCHYGDRKCATKLRTCFKCKLARVLPKIFFVVGDGICHAGDICVSARHSAGDGPWWSFREFLALLRPEYGPSRWGRRIEQFHFIRFQFLIFYREVGLAWSHLSKRVRGIVLSIIK